MKSSQVDLLKDGGTKSNEFVGGKQEKSEKLERQEPDKQEPDKQDQPNDQRQEGKAQDSVRQEQEQDQRQDDEAPDGVDYTAFSRYWNVHYYPNNYTFL